MHAAGKSLRCCGCFGTEEKMEKKNIDWSNLGFAYHETDKRFVANYKDGAWDEGELTSEARDRKSVV